MPPPLGRRHGIEKVEGHLARIVHVFLWCSALSPDSVSPVQLY